MDDVVVPAKSQEDAKSLYCDGERQMKEACVNLCERKTNDGVSHYILRMGAVGLQHESNFAIPSSAGLDNAKSLQLHVFVDASPATCGAVAYAQSETATTRRTSFVSSKTKVDQCFFS